MTAETRNEAEARAKFLAGRDVACPGCGYNLRGLTAARCPECSMEIVFPTGEEVQSDVAGMVAWLRDHDLICKKCRTNLRGQETNVCRGCGKSYMLQQGARTIWRGAGADEGTAHRRRRLTWVEWSIVLFLLGPVLLVLGAMLFLLLMALMGAVDRAV